MPANGAYVLEVAYADTGHPYGTWRTLRMRQREIAAQEFEGSPRALLFLDRHAIAVAAVVALVLLALAFIATSGPGGH